MALIISLLLFVLLLIVIPYLIARKRSLKCSKCGSGQARKTGKRKEDVPDVEWTIPRRMYIYYEYKCPFCGHKFRSTIESIWSLYKW